MDLPKNARVAIVDNRYDEVEALMEALASEGVPVVYYTGPEKFPRLPLSGVRLLFLDLELKGLSGPLENSRIAAAANNASTLLSNCNGPVVIVLWTKHGSQKVLTDFKRYLDLKFTNPYYAICMAKGDCKRDGEFSTAIIKQNLEKRLSEANVIGLHTAWENAVFNGSVRLSNRVAEVANIGGTDWSKVMSRAFYKLYEANSGKNTLFSFRDQFLSACEPYGKSLSNEIGVVLHKSDFDVSSRFRLNATELSDDDEQKLAGRINSLLFYDQESVDSESPGTVYIVEAKSRHSNILKALAADFFNSIKSEVLKSKDVSLCKIIITPACDCAQKKSFCPIVVTKKMRETKKLRTKFDRIVWAILVKHGAFKVEGKKTRCYTLENFEYSGAYYDLLIGLDAMGIEIVRKYKGRQKRLFSLTAQVLADLQSKASNQLNRIGICSVCVEK